MKVKVYGTEGCYSDVVPESILRPAWEHHETIELVYTDEEFVEPIPLLLNYQTITEVKGEVWIERVYTGAVQSVYWPADYSSPSESTWYVVL